MFNFLALLDIRVFGRLYIYITIVASDWPRTFFTPKVFCLAYTLLEQSNYVFLIEQSVNKVISSMV